MPTTEERVTQLEQLLGTKFLGMSSDQLAQELKPENTVAGGRYPYMLSDYQLHVALDTLVGTVIPGLLQRIKTLEETAAVPSGALDVKSALAAFDIHVAPRKLGIGMEPEADDASALQIGGRAAAVILGVSNTTGSDPQNPGEVHKNTFAVCDGDGGMRWRQYLQWLTTGKKRNTLNRRASILALDSMGDLCKSTEEVGATSDGGQSWYIRTEGLIVEFCTYKVGAFVRILNSIAAYGARDQAQL